jgi:hypothetical protein
MRRILAGVALILGLTIGINVVPVRMVQAAPRTRAVTIRATASHPDTAEAGTSFPLSHVGVRWHGALDAIVQVRWKVGPLWSTWRTVDIDHDMSAGGDGVVYGSLVRADGATAVGAHVVSGEATRLEVMGIDTVNGPRPWVRAPALPSAGADTAPPKHVAEPSIITRAQWGADESLRSGTPEYAPITKLVVHHTDTPNDDPDPPSTVRAIYQFHTQSRGWNDIGYNFLVDEAGHVYEGRFARDYATGETPTGQDTAGNGVVGAHALGVNRGSVGIALLGTFDNRQPTDAVMHSLETMFGWEADINGINPWGNDPFTKDDGTIITFPNISGHRDTSQTDCPGDLTYGRMPEIRQAVDNVIASAHGSTPGYWVAARNGDVFPFGTAKSYSSMAGHTLNAPIVGFAATPTGNGYWMLGSDGGIFSFGDARFYGSTGSIRLNQPVVGFEPTPTGNGYWLVASDGGIFAFGDAQFFGSTGSIKLNKPVVGMTATTDGSGYWLVASDGGIFAYGTAAFRGSTGSVKLNSPVVGMTAARTGDGYWLVARDGGIFAFNVPFRGSVPGLRLASYAGTVSMASTASSKGYYVLGADGGIFTFGDANFLGASSGLSGSRAAAGMALVPMTEKM